MPRIDQQLGVCFLGCGAMAERHIRALRALAPKARIAVASRDGARARAFGLRLGIVETFDGYDAALRSDVEVMVIATPPRSHRALIEAALAEGKHLLIEKPVVSGLDELVALWPTLTSATTTVMVAENDHFAPFHRRLVDSLRVASLGRPLFLDLTRLGRASPRGWRGDPSEMPLGALHEGGVHWIRRLMDLAGVYEDGRIDHVVELSAYGPSAPLTSTPGEDTTMIVARHRSGLTSRLLHTWALPWRFPPFDASKLLLEHGALYFDSRGLYARLYERRDGRWLLPALRDRSGLAAMWAHFLDCIEHERAPELSLAHVFADFAYLDAAYRARASGMSVVPQRAPKPAGGDG